MIRRAALALLALGAACDDVETAPRSLLQQPRILAVRATPPVIAPDGAAALDALAVDGDGRAASPALAWRACDPWRFVVDPDIDCGPDAALPLPGPRLDARAVLERFPPPGGQPPLDASWLADDDGCGDELRLDLPIVVEATVDGARLVAIKRVPIAVPTPQRTNPQLGALELDGAPAGRSYEPGAVYEVAIAPRTESLDEVCDDGAWGLESVRIHLYATAGRFDDSSLDVVYGPDGTRSAQLTGWTAPAAGPVELWLVAVDDDGGVGWASYSLR